MAIPLRVLIVEDSEDDALLLVLKLEQGEYTVTWKRVETADAMRAALTEQCWDIILADYSLPHFSGLGALEVLHASRCDIPFIVVSGIIGEVRAVEMMKAGAHDYVPKSNLTRLLPAVARELHEAESRQQRARAEEALGQERERAQQYLDIAGVIIVALDTEQRVTLINHKGAAVMGYSPQEIIGRNWFESFIPAAIRETVQRVWNQLIRGEITPVESFENPVLTRDGKERIIAWHNSVLRDNAGRITGTLSSGEDITERRQTENALDRERAFLASAIELLPFPMLFIAPGQEVIRQNRASREIFHETNQRSVWKSLQLLDPQTHAAISRAEWPLMRALLGEVVPATEWIMVFPDGREVPVLLYSAPIFAGGEFVAAVVAFQDISALKEADQAKNRFLMVLSHELKTPLTNIIGWAQMAESTADIAHEALSTILRNAFEQKTMLERLLTLSRILTGKLVLQRRQSDLWEFAALAAAHVYQRVADRGQTLDIHPPEATLPVMTDPRLLRQVIDELLDNAINFTPPGGVISLAAWRTQEMAVLAVRDSGRGFTPEQIGTLLRPFQQLVRDESTGGLGIGLALVKGIMDAHEGEVLIASPGLGQGSTFTIELPLAESPLPDQP